MLKSRIFYFLFTMVVTKLDCKKTDVNCRRSIALTGPDRHRKRVVMGLFQRLAHVHAEFLIVGNDVEARRVKRYIPKSRGFSKNRCFEDFFFRGFRVLRRIDRPIQETSGRPVACFSLQQDALQGAAPPFPITVNNLRT